ncbi:MAG: hypothetical protein ACLPWF_12055 [Bryobacteraceae bacterium]
MKNLLLAILAAGSMARGASIRDVDFKNFDYPFIHSEFVSVPNRLRWMPRARAELIAFRDGRHTLSCDDPPCELLTVDQVDFGDINGIQHTSAIVTVTFHTGGTADLILIVNDPEKREGDCCSTGTITYRYRFMNGSFRQIGAPILE